MKNIPKVPFIVLLSVLISPIVIGIALLAFEGTTYMLPKTHFYFVLASAFVSFLLAVFAFKEHKKSDNMTTFMVALGFMGVAILYAFHGLITPRYSLFTFTNAAQQINAFVFFGDMSRLWIAVLLFVPARIVIKNTDPLNKRYVMILTGVLLLMFSLIIVHYPHILPAVKAADGSDTLFTILFKVTTLIIIGIVSIRYYDSYKIKNNLSMLMLTIGTLFIFQAIVIFMISTPWGLIWWFAHFLYLFSYISIAIGIIYNYKKEDTIEYFDAMAQIQHYVDSLNHSNDQLRILATTDSLTGLYNRDYMLEHIDNRLLVTSLPFSVLFLDLNDFKTINDQYGHHIGDGVLVTISNRLTKALPKESVIGRIGGDEFIVILDTIDKEAIKKYCDNLFERLLQPIPNKQALEVTVSIGIALSPQDGQSIDDLIRHSDQAMYAAKQHETTCSVTFYDEIPT